MSLLKELRRDGGWQAILLTGEGPGAQLVRGSALAMALSVAGVILVFGNQIILARLLGPAAYGEYAVVISWVAVQRITYEEADARMQEAPFDAIRRIADAYRARRLERGAAREESGGRIGEAIWSAISAKKTATTTAAPTIMRFLMPHVTRTRTNRCARGGR